MYTIILNLRILNFIGYNRQPGEKDERTDNANNIYCSTMNSKISNTIAQ